MFARRLAVAVLLTAGCAPESSTFQITDHRQGAQTQRYCETFEEAYYDLNSEGNIDIALRRVSPSSTGPGRTITQVIHLHSFWRSIPGKTTAETTQINGTVRYMIRTGYGAVIFEGTGSIFFEQNAAEDEITGALEYALLSPAHRLSTAPELFENAELTGEFRAVRNPRQVVRLVNELNRASSKRRAAAIE